MFRQFCHRTFTSHNGIESNLGRDWQSEDTVDKVAPGRGSLHASLNPRAFTSLTR